MTLAAPACASAEPADAWRRQPITLVLPFPAGGTSDLLARLAPRESVDTRIKYFGGK
jgi:tripartite-type tricarboxylate transporter receptor subunit TctC